MAACSQKTSKPNGRPNLLSEAERREVATLYLDLNWTITQIQKKFTGIRSETLRAIAHRQRRKDLQSKDQPHE